MMGGEWDVATSVSELPYEALGTAIANNEGTGDTWDTSVWSVWLVTGLLSDEWDHHPQKGPSKSILDYEKSID